MAARIDHVVTSGTFSLDGETHEVDNNVWVVGDDSECVVIDAPHSADDILALVGERTLTAIVCTHAHDDHVRVAPELRERTGAPIYLHPDDRPVWELTHGDAVIWDHDLSDGLVIEVAGTSRLWSQPASQPGEKPRENESSSSSIARGVNSAGRPATASSARTPK